MARCRSLLIIYALVASVIVGALPASAATLSAVSSFTGKVADGQVSLAWTANKSAGFSHYEVRQFSVSQTPSRSTGTAVYSGTATSKMVTGLTNGRAYKFAIWSVDAANSASAIRTVVVQAPVSPTSLTISPSASTVRYGTSVVLRGALLAELSNGSVLLPFGERVELRAGRPGATVWGLVQAKTTNTAGAVAFRHTPTRHTQYRLVHAQTPRYGASVSPLVTVKVRATMTGDVTSIFVGTGKPIAANGTVRPAHPGKPVYLLRRTTSGWARVASGSETSTGRYTISYAPPSSGAHYLRVYRPGDGAQLGVTKALPTVTATSRTLRAGMSGSDVLALQRQLARSHYDVGPINGRFGYDTLHAVVPFQKVNNMGRDGIVGPLVRARMGRPTVARMREVRSGGHVEIDLTKQVIVLGYNGRVFRIIDTSTGSNALYTVDGVTSRATTPLGRYAFTRKINGVRISRLGELYRPAYFVGGYAIHGSKSVPPQPASHGCLRVTNQSQDRHYDRWVVGMPVWLFRS